MRTYDEWKTRSPDDELRGADDDDDNVKIRECAACGEKSPCAYVWVSMSGTFTGYDWFCAECRGEEDNSGRFVHEYEGD